MTLAKRPLGVSVLSVLGFLNVAVYLVLLVLAIAAPGTLRSVLEGLSPQGAGPSALLNLGPAVMVYFAVMVVLAALFAWGMWTVRGWARWVTIIIAALSLIGTLAEIAQVGGDLRISTALLALVRVGLSVLVLWYLWRPLVRSAFRSRKVQSAEAG